MRPVLGTPRRPHARRRHQGALVNKGDARCIEIWNLVFIQFNANPDGTFSPLPAKHVDTGMGFERVTSIIQGTKEFTDLRAPKFPITRPTFSVPSSTSWKNSAAKNTAARYPEAAAAPMLSVRNRRKGYARQPEVRQRASQKVVTSPSASSPTTFARLSFSIADGILPGNNDRNYVLRRILRRAVRYGRTLGFHEPFFYKLVDVLADTMGEVFPEIRAKEACAGNHQLRKRRLIKLWIEEFNCLRTKHCT